MLLKNSLIYLLLNASGHRSENIGDNHRSNGVCAVINPRRQDFPGIPILLKSMSIPLTVWQSAARGEVFLNIYPCPNKTLVTM